MAKQNEKNTDAAKLADETRQQPEVTGSQQLDPAVDPVPVLSGAETVADALTAEIAALAASASPEPAVPADLTGNAQATSPATLPEPAVSTEETLAAPAERWTVQAVAVPNNRRMRGGTVFTDIPVTVYRDAFSDAQWRAILHDKHLKAIRLDD